MLSENKFRKYFLYAVGEIFLVMIGILLALQVNNWNENRKINKQEIQLLESIHKEFRVNRDELTRSINKAETLKNRCLTLLENTGSHEMKLSRDESDSLLNSGLLNIITFDASSGIINDIINSGKIHILQNEKLKYHLSNWGGILNDVKEDETWAVNARNNIIFPFIYRNANYVSISQTDEYYKYTSGFNTNYKDIYTLLEFENLVNSHLVWNSKNKLGYQRLKKLVDEIILLCEEDLKSKNK